MPNKNKQSWEERFDKIVIGIDKDETEDGWWETSTGADFGKNKKDELKSFISQEIEEAYDRGAMEATDACNISLELAKQEERERISREIREDDKVVEEIPQFKGTREALNNLTKLKEE